MGARGCRYRRRRRWRSRGKRSRCRRGGRCNERPLPPAPLRSSCEQRPAPARLYGPRSAPPPRQARHRPRPQNTAPAPNTAPVPVPAPSRLRSLSRRAPPVPSGPDPAPWWRGAGSGSSAGGAGSVHGSAPSALPCAGMGSGDAAPGEYLGTESTPRLPPAVPIKITPVYIWNNTPLSAFGFTYFTKHSQVCTSSSRSQGLWSTEVYTAVKERIRGECLLCDSNTNLHKEEGSTVFLLWAAAWVPEDVIQLQQETSCAILSGV
nr:wiskott-Aldrich syndrome protein homolog 1-like [Anas platyrhynchos]